MQSYQSRTTYGLKKDLNLPCSVSLSSNKSKNQNRQAEITLRTFPARQASDKDKLKENQILILYETDKDKLFTEV